MGDRQLSNKQLWVLSYLREHSDGVTAKQVAADSPIDEVRSAELTEKFDRDYEIPSMTYGDAYVVLKQLRSRGLVRRECMRDQFGDELPRHIYFAVTSEPNQDDPLEKAFALPAAEGHE